MALTDTIRPIPSAAALRALRRSFERTHTPPMLKEGTFALTALGVYVCLGVLWWLTTRPSTVLTTSFLRDTTEQWNSTWGWVLTGVLMAVVVTGASALGPVSVRSETAWWLLPTLVDRRAMLRPRIGAALGIGGAAGLTGGRLAAFVGELEHWLPFTMLGAGLGISGVALGVLVQCGVLPAWALRVVTAVCVSGAGVAAIVAAAGGTVVLITSWIPVLVVSIVAVALSVISVWRCGRITLARMVIGSETTVAASVSLTMLDLSIVTGALEQRAWRRVARRASRRVPTSRTRALIRIDAMRHARRPHSLALATGAVCTGWALSAVLSPIAAAGMYLAIVFGVCMIFSVGLRALCADTALAVMLGADDRLLRLPLTAIPVMAAVVTMVLSAPLVATNPTMMALTTVGAVTAMYRIRTRASLTYDGLILETGFGQVPVELIRQKTRGTDALVLTAALLAVCV
ncbi:ABC transporter permease [Rhodococcus sp. HNM0563]|uniref:DUF6297 family protein n=1 Tax=Rhodococcus sp. HNM0563 TaxID=2716339 RepID=UPI00146B99D2|nr:DUF6297 family protein [Rhodococcus sp. HNM0563]NLU64870.1 ABC transporter permease [Rhodococcus sp. HNM0563]